MQTQLFQIRQNLEQVQERQKTLAILNMKLAQGDQLDITPYLSQPGLAAAGQGKAQQVKVEHAHWRQQEAQLTAQVGCCTGMVHWRQQEAQLTAQVGCCTVEAWCIGASRRRG